MDNINNLQIVNHGDYYMIKPVEDTTAEDYIRLYKAQFEKQRGSDRVYFLINLLDLPSVLGVDAFSTILSDADRFKIKHIEMVLATNDDARPIIGIMLESLSKTITSI